MAAPNAYHYIAVWIATGDSTTRSTPIETRRRPGACGAAGGGEVGEDGVRYTFVVKALEAVEVR